MSRKPRTIEVEDVFLTDEERAARMRSAAMLPQSPMMPPTVPDEVEEDEVTALNNILSEIGGRSSGGGYVNVFREITLAGGKVERPYLGQMQAADFVNGGFIESLKQQYGAGKYDLCVYVSGHRGVYDRKKITIADDRAGAPPVHSAPSLNADILRVIQEGNDRTLQGLQALAQALQQKPQSNLEKLQEMKLMAEIFRGNTAPAAPLFNPLEAIKLGAELASNGGGVGTDSNGEWVSKMIDTFGKPMMSMLQQPQPTTPRQAAPVHPALNHPSMVATSTIPSTPQTEDSMNPLISFYLQSLKTRAAKGEEVAPVADDILGRLAPDEANDLMTLLKSPTWREQLRHRAPFIDQYPAWFDKLRDTLIEYYQIDMSTPSPVEVNPVILTTIPASAIQPSHDREQYTPINPDESIPGGAA